MADFTRELLDNDVSSDEAWRRITEHIKNGAKSVEVLRRTIDGTRRWELRIWRGVRDDGSNAARTKPSRADDA